MQLSRYMIVTMAGAKRKIGLKFKDEHGKTVTRSTSDDFQTLPHRHLRVVYDIKGVKGNPEVIDLLDTSLNLYEVGQYSAALDCIKKLIKLLPALEPFLFYYKKICSRVLAVQPYRNDIEYEINLEREQSKSRLAKAFKPNNLEARLRCKWCGHYTRYVDPNEATFGFALSSNMCNVCGHMYPMPSWMWDSPDGRAYSYYRLSFGGLSGEDGKIFYSDFLGDYSPKPTVEESGLFGDL